MSMQANETLKGSLKDLDKRAREVFKPILENPYTQGPDFPVISKETSRDILEFLNQFLPSYGNYLGLKNKKDIPAHALSGKITIGFNSTVQALESQAFFNRKKAFNTVKAPPKRLPIEGYLKYVFVARNDISTPLLTDMLPLLAFTASKSLDNRVKLIDLPRGSMNKLLELLQTKNIGIVGILDEWREGKEMFNLIESNVKDIDVPWLRGLFESETPGFKEPAIKFLRAIAPVGKRPGKKERKQKKVEEKAKVVREKNDDSDASSKRKADSDSADAPKAKKVDVVK